MSQYNKTVLTRAGLELAKRVNAGQAKFGITRAVTSADDWSNKTVQDLEEVTTIPNIMQQGTIMDTDEVESNNSVIGVSLCFTNKNLSTGYQIRIIGLYVKEEGQENDFLYAVTTAITPEYMPSFADKVLYRFNTQMYLVIGNAQSVNVVINDGTAVTHGQLDKYKAEVTENLKKLENTHKEDMSHVAKSASVNGGAEILPDSTGKLNLVVPDPDLSKYVSLEQLGELLKAKADVADVPDKTDTEEGIKQAKAAAKVADDKAQSALDSKADKADTYTKSNIDDIHSKSYFRKQGIDQNGNAIEIRTNAVKQSNGGYAIDIYDTDWTASKLADVLTQLPNKADTSTVNAQITDAKNTIKSNADNLQSAINTKANASDLSALQNSAMQVIDGNSGDDILSFRDEKIRRYTSTQNIKNLPAMSNISWFYVITHTKDGWGNVTVISQDNCYWQNAINGSNWSGWVKHATSVDITDLQNQINAKLNKTDAVNVVNYYDVNNNQSGELQKWPITRAWYVDQIALRPFADQINQLKGRRQVDRPDFNNLTDTGTYYVSNPGANAPTGSWGNLLVSNGAGHRTSQMYFPDDGSALYMRELDETTWHGWIQLATSAQVNDLQNQIQQLRDNQFEVQTFTDATAAANWEAQRQGKRMAIVNS